MPKPTVGISCPLLSCTCMTRDACHHECTTKDNALNITLIASNPADRGHRPPIVELHLHDQRSMPSWMHNKREDSELHTDCLQKRAIMKADYAQRVAGGKQREFQCFSSSKAFIAVPPARHPAYSIRSLHKDSGMQFCKHSVWRVSVHTSELTPGTV